jgi:hypothetical protein
LAGLAIILKIIGKIPQKGAVMEKQKIQVDKQAYEKPVLTKHGRLKDVTVAERIGSPQNAGSLGCTRF